MAGRGRGRGRSVSFNIESLGFGRGESLPGPILQPPPIFPVAEFKPVPLLESEEYDYLLALKQEFRGTMRKSPFFITASEKKRDINRYSDKYQLTQEQSNKLKQVWSRLPAELKPRKARKTKSQIKPKVPSKKAKNVDEREVHKTLEELEKKENELKDEEDHEADEEEEKKEKAAEDDDEEELYDEDDVEEDTDYIQSYFDNGEDYGNDDDDVDEGPIY